ncbi:MAG: hypothetical protein VR72_11465 [Clostridiaceae bacterium BRH_c20a]|nr:MAG: hypothetical protein VR72_11465 [Clostridiaceae bacterium BRH_c20a]
METLVRCPNAYEIREKGLVADEKVKKEILSSLTEEQERMIKDGKLAFIDPITYFDTLMASLHMSIVQIGVEVSKK